VAGAYARVLISVCCDIGDEFLSCEREEAGEVGGCLWGRRQAGEGEVVICYHVRDLDKYRHERVSERESVRGLVDENEGQSFEAVSRGRRTMGA